MKIGAVFILIFLISSVCADVFSTTSGQGEISIGGISGNQTGFFTGIPAIASSTPSPAPSGGGGGGGAGGILILPIQNLTVSPSSFNLPASVGITSSASVVLENTGNSDIDLIVSVSGIGDIVKFNQTSFIIPANKSKILNFIIEPPDNAGIYSGKIFFSSGNRKTSIPIVINVGEGQSLFDVFVKIPQSYRQITRGQNLVSNISLVQKGAQKETDVTLQYTIQDFEDNVYYSDLETIAVLDEKNYQKEFNTSSLSPGDYIIGAKAIYSGGIATASSTFTVLAAGNETAGEISQKEGFFRGIASSIGNAFKTVGTFFKNVFGAVASLAEKLFEDIKGNFRAVAIILGALLWVVALFFIVRFRKKIFKPKQRINVWRYGEGISKKDPSESQ